MAHNFGQVKTPTVYLDFINYYTHLGHLLSQNSKLGSAFDPSFSKQFSYLDPHSLAKVPGSNINNGTTAEGVPLVGYSFGNLPEADGSVFDHILPDVHINYCAVLSHEFMLNDRTLMCVWYDRNGTAYPIPTAIYEQDASTDVEHLNATATALGGTNFMFDNHGSSIVKLDTYAMMNSTITGLGAISLNQQAMQGTETDDDNHDNMDNEFYKLGVGAVSFGTYFKFPQSPDLSVGTSRDFDFLSKSESISGKEYSTINNSGPIFGHGEQPFGTYDYGPLVTENGDGTIDYNKNHHSLHKFRRVGRRVWEISFSQIGADDMFHAYESGTIDEWTETTISDGWYGEYEGSKQIPVTIDDPIFKLITYTHAGRLPFIFQPDSDDNSPNGFCLATLDMNSFTMEQESFERYSISFVIRESW